MNRNETIVTSTFRSRWGFHPCDYATYLRLKRLNHLIEQAKHLAAEQWRFDRKTANRGMRFERIVIGGRPVGWRRIENAVTRPQSFLEYKLELRGHRRRPSIGQEAIGALYRAARTPSAAPPEPFDADRVGEALGLLERLEIWMARTG